MGYRDLVLQMSGSGGKSVMSDSTPKQDEHDLFGLHVRDANPGKQLANILGVFSVTAVAVCILIILGAAFFL